MNKYILILFVIFYILLNSCNKQIYQERHNELTRQAINKTINQLMDSGYIK